jgi:V8-like Glu-specific endopeptidase
MQYSKHMRLDARLQPVAAALAIATAMALAVSAAPAATASAAASRHDTTRHGAAGHAAAATKSQQLAVLRYWTRSRMEHAVPAGPAAPAAGLPVRPLALLAADGQPPGRVPAAGAAASPVLPVPLGGRLPHQEFLAAPARIAATAPATPGSTGSQWQGGGAVAQSAGKVFFTLGGTDYVCSGSTVASANADVAVTAAHCVTDGNGNWATNWTFVPGYVNGSAPYGRYTARRFFVASQWSSGAAEDYDVAFVALGTATVGGLQAHAVTAAGGLGITFGSHPAQEYAFGYPSAAPYNGRQLEYCNGTTSPDPYHATSDTGLHCAITEGASGGPWLSGFKAGTGTITSVSSFKYNDGSEITYGPALGSAARSLYGQAEHA